MALVALVSFPAPATTTVTDYEDIWYNAPAGSESGWGVNIAQQGDVWFAAWYTYDADGNPAWFVMPRGTRTSGEAFSGTGLHPPAVPTDCGLIGAEQFLQTTPLGPL